MKKNILSLALLCAIAFVHTNCDKQITDPKVPEKEGMPFELAASTEVTKTANDGMNTIWVSNDALNIFHAEAGSTTYGTNDKFTFTVDNTFSGLLTEGLDADKSYDWYALYPYNEYISSPGEQTSGYVYIGHSTGAIQNGYNNTSHLATNLCPLYGVSKNVGASTPVNINMKHLTSVVKIVVKNTTTESLTVSSITFSTGADIVGPYYIDFAGSEVKYTGKASSTKTVANLSVSSATALAQNETASFYIPIKPHIATSGSTISITVNGYKKTKLLEADTEFVAGKIKTLNFKYDYVVDPASPVWDLSLDSTSEATTDKIAWTSDWADMVCEKSNATTPANSYYPGVGQSSTRFYLKSVLTITPKAEKAITYYTFTATTSGYASALENSTWTNVKASNATASEPYIVTIVPKDPASPVSAVLSGTTGLTKVEIHTDTAPVFAPVINVAANSISVPATGGSSEIEYTIKNPVDGQVISASSDQTWISGFDYSTEGKVKFLVAGNTESDRQATITLSYEGAENESVTIKQSIDGVITFRHVFTAKPSIGENVDLSGVKWNISATNLGNYNSANYAGVQFGTSSKNGQITLTSPTAWSYTKDEVTVSKVKEIRLWLNMGGTSVTPKVSIGEKVAISDGTVVVKNSAAGTDWTKATKVTFTPAEGGDAGVVVIDVTSVKAGYICAIEIDSIN